MKGKIEVAMTHLACRVCGKDYPGDILINKKLTKKYADYVKSLHMKTVGFLEEPCEDCKIDGVYLIGVIPEKTDDRTNPYRSGHLFGIKREAWSRIFSQPIPEHGMAYVEVEVLRKMGFIDENGEANV